MTNVLVVDDDSAIRRAVCSILELAGYGVCEAADGQFALDHLCEHPHDHVILLDLEMPRLNGVRTLEALAQQPFVRLWQAIIVMTASARMMPPAFADVPILRKPFDIDALEAHVAHAERCLLADFAVS